MRVLITGFGAFGSISDNPSGRLLSQFGEQGLEGADELRLEQLPVAYRQAGARIRELLDGYAPDLCIMLGVADNRQRICLERIAINLDDSSLADNDEDLASDREIVPGAPLALRSDLPLEELAGALNAALEGPDGPAEPAYGVSNHAGNFVCNHLYYNALEHAALRGLSAPCLFIHVPMSLECNAGGKEYGWTLASQETLFERVRAAVRAVLGFASEERSRGTFS